MTNIVNSLKPFVADIDNEVLEALSKSVTDEGTGYLLKAVNELLSETGDNKYQVKLDIILDGQMYRKAKDKGNTVFTDMVDSLHQKK